MINERTISMKIRSPSPLTSLSLLLPTHLSGYLSITEPPKSPPPRKIEYPSRLNSGGVSSKPLLLFPSLLRFLGTETREREREILVGYLDDNTQ